MDGPGGRAGAREESARELRAAFRLQDLDAAMRYAGQAVGLVREERPAVEIVAELARSEDLLRAAAGD